MNLILCHHGEPVRRQGAPGEHGPKGGCEGRIVIGIVAPAGSGLPGGSVAAALSGAAFLPVTGIPVLVMHGPIATRAALGITSDRLLIRSLAPLLPSTRLRRDEIDDIAIEDGHWYAFGRRVICIRRVKGPSLRLMAPSVSGVPDSTGDLGHLLRAWWRSGRGR